MDQQLDNKTKAIMMWLLRNKHLLNQTASSKIQIHIKGESVSGEITQFPDSKL